MRIASRLRIHRSVEEHGAILSCFGTFFQGNIVEGKRELLIHLFCTMNQSHTWRFDAHFAAHIHIVSDHSIQMIQLRIRNHRRIREEEQLIIRRYLGHGNMTQHIPFRKQAMLLVQYRTKQVIRIDNPFHQHIGMAFTHQEYAFLSSHIGTACLKHFHMVGILLTDVFGIQYMRCIRHQQEIGKALLQTSQNDIFRMRVVRTNYRNTLTLFHRPQTTN